MAYYLVRAEPRDKASLDELESRLEGEGFGHMKPFGKTLTHSLRNARMADDGRLVWEEEDYCRPPLAEEREAVLDDYFEELDLERVSEGEGWQKIDDLPPVYPDLSASDE